MTSPPRLPRPAILLTEGAVTCRLVSGDNAAAKRAKRLAELAVDRRVTNVGAGSRAARP